MKEGRICSRLFSLTCQWLSSPCVFTSSSLYLYLSPSFPFYKDTSHIGLGPTLCPHFNLITSVKILSPNMVTFWGTGDFNIWIWGRAGGYNSTELHNSSETWKCPLDTMLLAQQKKSQIVLRWQLLRLSSGHRYGKQITWIENVFSRSSLKVQDVLETSLLLLVNVMWQFHLWTKWSKRMEDHRVKHLLENYPHDNLTSVFRECSCWDIIRVPFVSYSPPQSISSVFFIINEQESWTENQNYSEQTDKHKTLRRL